MSLPPPRSRRFTGTGFRIRYAVLAVLVAIAVGTLGLHFIEGWPPLKSLYLATQTVTTIGFGDITPQTDLGRAFITVFMLASVGVVLYALTSTVQSIVQLELLATFGERRRSRKMTKLRNHYNVCGAGRVGLRLVRSLVAAEEAYRIKSFEFRVRRFEFAPSLWSSLANTHVLRRKSRNSELETRNGVSNQY